MGTAAALIASAAITAISQQSAAKKQSRALRGAAGLEAASSQRLIDLQEQLFEGLAPFRETALETLPLIREEALGDPGSSELFQRGLRGGTEAITKQLSAVGLGESSVLGKALGEFTTGLTSADIGRISNLRRGLLGGASAGFQQTAGLEGLIGQSFGRQGQFGVGIGATQAGLLGAQGGILAQLPLLFSLLGNQQPQTTSFGSSASGAGAGVGGGAVGFGVGRPS
jgi:hypothetical protein